MALGGLLAFVWVYTYVEGFEERFFVLCGILNV